MTDLTAEGIGPGRAARAHQPSRRQLLAAAAAGLVAAGADSAYAQSGQEADRRQPQEPAAERSGLVEGAGRRRGGPPLRQAVEVRGACRPPDVEWLTASRESSVNFTPLHELDGIITPNGLCFERHHGGIAQINPLDHRLMINGLVDKPLLFTMDDIKRFPRVNRIYFLECAANSGMEWRGAQLNGCQFTHGMVHNVMYTGVPLKLILDEAGLKPNAKWLLLEGADSAGMTRSLPIEKALKTRCSPSR